MVLTREWPLAIATALLIGVVAYSVWSWKAYTSYLPRQSDSATVAKFLNFELSDASGKPVGWHVSSLGRRGRGTYSGWLDSEFVREGRYSARLEGEASETSGWIIGEFGEPQLLGGKRVTMTGWIKARDVISGGYLMLLAMNRDKQRKAQATSDKLYVTNDWVLARCSLDVEPGMTRVMFAGVLESPGTVWFDAFKFDTNGVQYRP